NDLKAVQDWVLNRVLKQVPGVADVTGYGGTTKQYQVLIDPQRLRFYNVSMQEVEDAIQRSNANVGGDVLSLGSQAHNVRAVGLLGKGKDPIDPVNAPQARVIEAEKIEDINRVIIATHHGVPIRVGQLAEVIIGHKPRLGIVGRAGENDVVEGIVLM